jgi:4'-phosphopantetheinyl transferase
MKNWSGINNQNLEKIKRLPAREAHLWFVSLSLALEKFSRFESLLSFDEMGRASRFRNLSLRRRYIAARGWLRTLLGSYLAMEPQRLRFSYNDLGKPRLADQTTALSFSISHCEDWALLGFICDRNIGVDLERVRADIETDVIAQRFFLPNEIEQLQSLPPAQKLQAFYCAWTRKEAYLKARGLGLFRGLDRIEVSLLPDEPAKIVNAADDPGAAVNWMVKHLRPAPDYVAAAAVDTTQVEFRYFDSTQEQRL